MTLLGSNKDPKGVLPPSGLGPAGRRVPPRPAMPATGEEEGWGSWETGWLWDKRTGDAPHSHRGRGNWGRRDPIGNDIGRVGRG